MKEYLNSEEVFAMMKLLKLYSDVETDFIEGWAKRKNLAKKELTYLKTSMTWGLKAVKSILDRQDLRTRTKIQKLSKTVYIRLVDGYAEKQLEDKLNDKIDKAVKDDESIRTLLEASMDTACANCKKDPMACSLYHWCCDNIVEEPSGEDYKGKKCRYGYYVSAEKELRLASANMEVTGSDK